MIQEIKRLEIEAGERFQISPCVLAIIIDEYCNRTDNVTPKDVIVFGDVHMKNPGILILNTEHLRNIRNWYSDTAEEYDWAYHMQAPDGHTPKTHILNMFDIICKEKDKETVIRLNV